jgi:hypothetical protein
MEFRHELFSQRHYFYHTLTNLLVLREKGIIKHKKNQAPDGA